MDGPDFDTLVNAVGSGTREFEGDCSQYEGCVPA
jgi:hypothetical protein